jgi:hypothetical protein
MNAILHWGIGVKPGVNNPAMLANPQPAIPLPFPKVAGYSANRDRLLRRTAAASATIAGLLAILLASFLSLLLVLN